MKHRIGCCIKGCKSNTSYPVGWALLDEFNLYLCPDCVMKHCIYDGVNVKTLNDIPIKKEAFLEEQS